MNEADDELTTVFATGDGALVAVAKAVLDGAGIRYYVKGEKLQGLAGVGSFGANFLTGSMEIQVCRRDADQTRGILKELEESSSEPAPQQRKRRTFVWVWLILPILMAILVAVVERVRR